MTVLKGIFVYTLILLGLLLGVGIIIFGIMFFVPEFAVFGYKLYNGSSANNTYIVIADDSGESQTQLDVLPTEAKTFDALVINAGSYIVNITTKEEGDVNPPIFEYTFNQGLFGFIQAEAKGPSVSVGYSASATVPGLEGTRKTITLTIKEPEGILINRQAILTINIPSNKTNVGTIYIKNNNSAVSIQPAELHPNFTLGNLVVDNGKSTIAVNKTTVTNRVVINKLGGSFKISENIAASLLLNCEQGEYVFKNVNTSGSNFANAVDITALNANIQIGDVNGFLSLRTDLGLFRAGSIAGDFSAVGYSSETTRNSCDINVGAILGDASISNKGGNIHIGQLSKLVKAPQTYASINTKAEIYSTSGNLTIDNCFTKYIKVVSERGSILINNMASEANISTTYGNVELNYITATFTLEGYIAAQIESAVAQLATLPIKVATGVNRGDGNITVKNSMGKLDLQAKGSGAITATISKITSASVIKSDRGKVDIVVPNQEFWLKWFTNKNAKVEVFSIVKQDKKSTNAATNDFIGIQNPSCTHDTTSPANVSLDVLASGADLKIIDFTRL